MARLSGKLNNHAEPLIDVKGCASASTGASIGKEILCCSTCSHLQASDTPSLALLRYHSMPLQ